MLSSRPCPLLSIQDLEFSYDRRGTVQRAAAIRSLSLEIGHGELHGLVGLNGAGKTTLISLITGLLRPQKGVVRVEGQPARPGNAVVSLVPQEYAFYNRLTVFENLRYFAALSASVLAEGTQSAIARVMRICQLDALRDQRAGTLSGGEKRRLNLAIGLLPQVRLLILDEPTANVDPHSRAVILGILQDLNVQGVGILYTSHLLTEIESICSHVSILDNGTLRLSGSMEDIDTQGAETLEIVIPAGAQAKFDDHPDGWHRVDSRLSIDMRHETLAGVLAHLERQDIRPLSLRYSRTSLRTLLQRFSTTGDGQ